MSRSFTRTAAARRTDRRHLRLRGTAAAAPTGDGTAPRFQEPCSSTFQVQDRGYIVNGDEPATSPGPCASSTTPWSTSRTLKERASSSTGSTAGRQVVGEPGNQPHLLRQHEVRRRLHAIVTAMADGGGQGEAATTKVNFIYVPAQDGSRTTREPARGFLGRADQDQRSTSPAPSSPAGRSRHATSWSTPRASATQGPGPPATSSRTSWATPSASGTSTPDPRPAPASRTTTGAADAVRLGVDHALPPVQRVVRRPEHDRQRPGRHPRAVRQLTGSPSEGTRPDPPAGWPGGRAVPGRHGPRPAEAVLTRSGTGHPPRPGRPPVPCPTGRRPWSARCRTPPSDDDVDHVVERSLICQPSVIGSSWPGRTRVVDGSGSSELGQQGLGDHGVRRYADADGVLLRVEQAARDLPRRRQDERVGPGGGRLDRTEHRVAHVHELAELGEVGATSVKWCRASRWRISLIRSRASWVPTMAPRA